MAITEMILSIKGTLTSPVESIKVMVSRREILVISKAIRSIAAKEMS
jgi:hypothetical protein